MRGSMRSFENDEIKILALFEAVLGVQARDCIIDNDSMYFLVDEGKAKIAIGKKGVLIKKMQNKTQRRIKVFEYNGDNAQFVKNMIPKAKKVEIQGKRAVVSLDEGDKALVIGKGGSNIKKIREFLSRNSTIEGLDIK